MPTSDDFTGERFLPECTGEIWAEHWHRYLFAARHVAGRDVLDAACGEGYGAAWLARHAQSVTGLDVDAPTVAAARAKYRAPGLRFAAGSVAAMPFADASFDCAVSFETLEHLAEQQAMLAELRRVLRPDGVLIISTPNKVEYSEKRDFHNEFHVRELSEDEFRALLGRNFGAQRWYGQRLVFNSAMWPLPAATGDGVNAEWIAVEASDRTMPPPMYFVAVVAAAESMLPSAAGATLLVDPDDAMYHEYMLTVARGRMLERLIAERERLIVERDGQIEAANQARAERERLIAERDGQLATLNARIATAEELIVARERIIVERDGQLAAVNARLATAEGLIAERERIIVERDGQLAELNARMAAAEAVMAALQQGMTQRDQRLLDQDRQLDQRAEHIEALMKTSQELRYEVARRAGGRWWLALPFLRIRRMFSPSANASHQDGP